MELSIKFIDTKEDAKKYYTSKEAKKILKLSDCKLAHLRIEGYLEFKKVGNKYLYINIENNNKIVKQLI